MKLAKWNRQYINGAYVEGSSNTYYKNQNPYNGETLAEIKLAGKADIDAAYEAARRAQKEWEATSPFHRAQVMEKVAKLFEERAQEIDEIIIAEVGANHISAHIAVGLSIGITKETVSYPTRMTGEIVPSIIPGKENRIYRKPVGVVGVISPWNFPLNLSMRAVAAAVATGNGVVIKPDIQTYISGGLIIADIFAEAGVPQGLVNVVVADLAEIGDYFVEHPIPRMISFTGSSAAGRRIGKICGEQLKKSSLELGGNSAFVVLDDANLEDAASAAVFGKYIHQGQVCMAINRIFVDRKVYEPFIDIFKAKASKLKVGDPAEASTFIGPMINRKQVDRLLGLVEKSVQEGAKLVLEGKVKDNVVEPFVLRDVRNDMTIAQNEIFGPVASIIPFDGEEEAIELANNTIYGLSGAVFSGSIERGVRVAQRIHTGMIHVNDQSIQDEPLIAFGGEKASGLGRFGSQYSLEEFTTLKWVSVQHETRPYPV